jgi:transposase
VDEPVAEVRGVNVHAKQLVDGRDRKQLERLCRYITRPPFSQDRLELRTDGRVELALKRVWRDGTRAVVYEPRDFLARLIAAIPSVFPDQMRHAMRLLRTPGIASVVDLIGTLPSGITQVA